jgi:hypothetical protein
VSWIARLVSLSVLNTRIDSQVGRIAKLVSLSLSRTEE